MSDPLLADQATDGERIVRFIANTNKIGSAKLTVERLNIRINLLSEYWKAYCQRHNLICRQRAQLAEDEYFTTDQYSFIEETYVSAHAELLERIAARKGPPAELPSSQGPESSVVQLLTSSSCLPKLSLPKFSGNQLEWETFKELFCAMVKDAPSLSPIVKLQHLLSCLEGDAARRLKNFQITGTNFTVAWDTLVRRYDNKRVRLAAQMNRLIAMPPASKKAVQEITRLLDVTEECIRAMKFLGRPVDQWDDWFVQILVFKLDSSTREDWEISLEAQEDFPTYQKLVKFLENRCRSLDAARTNDSSFTRNPHEKRSFNAVSKSFSAHHAATSQPKQHNRPGCSLCRKSHFVAYCPNLLKQSTDKRMETIREARLCSNCLRPDHSASNCPSLNRCSVCREMHHTRLHKDRVVTASNNPIPQEKTSPIEPTPSTSSQPSNKIGGYSATFGKTTLLATAIVTLESPSGSSRSVRALLDPAAEGSFITESTVQALSLSKRPNSVSISGVGGETTAMSKCSVHVILRPRHNLKSPIDLNALVLPKLTSLLPRQGIQLNRWAHLSDLDLADPNYHQPSRIDCILGADVYSELLLEGVRKGSPDAPVAQQTLLGWILTGPVNTTTSSGHNATLSSFHTAVRTTISEELRRFWEIEEVPAKIFLSQEEEECEQHFVRTHSRDNSGRYVIRLPFSRVPSSRGSRAIATSRFLNIERRLQRSPELAMAYTSFIREYTFLGHMELVPDSEIGSSTSFYLPHHAVVKQDGSGKLRVVFNASQKTNKGLSLNDCLHIGPKLQTELPSILSRWRFFPFVFTADIVKMFRQIRVHDLDTDWQRILWRDTADQEIRTFRLLTVTYGTACAPYLAIRVLRQLADDEGQRCPIAADILRFHTYVDDALAGGDTREAAVLARDDLIEILSSGGMTLAKWAANDPIIIPPSYQQPQSELSFDDADVVSTLGLRWCPKDDCFRFKVNLNLETSRSTKRTVLSEVARLFDPMGWLAPVVVTAKILIQTLWIRGSDWDSPIDDDILSTWKTFRQQLPVIETFQIPRWLCTYQHSTWVLHGFADASERAYAAVVYLVTWDQNHQVSTQLLISKTKVAPIKTISVPKLELCAALLLARLLSHLASSLLNAPAATFCWSDSKVVLDWLRGHPSQWKTFVANRVSSILSLVPQANWGHVKSKENPADLATRGISPQQLREELLWWKGPSFLSMDLPVSSPSLNVPSLAPDRVDVHAALLVPEEEELESLLRRFSTLVRLLRSVAYILRWKESFKSRKLRFTTLNLKTDELEHSRRTIIKAIQKTHFCRDLSLLKAGQPIHRSSQLMRLSPFIDADGILRVGGRLHFSHLQEEEKHPIIIPKNSHFAELLIRQAHLRTLHGGPQLIQSHLLREFWIVHSRNRIRAAVRNCVRCARFRRQRQEQQMAPLPAVRLTPSRPFSTTGVDYAGPFALRTSKGRGLKSFKGYVAIFICLVTRAVHIEVVSDYTSETFLAAFRRFTARRGLCQVIYSDNGTTFQGADAELRRLFTATSDLSQEIASKIALDGVHWSFIPPRAPHFGGLWEAAVKSFKHHLRRVVGDAKLTFEEFYTLTTQIEACLNSRPLSPLSSNPEDVAALTPGHFLTGSALTAPPEPFLVGADLSHGKRWHHIIQMRNHFWSRWRKEVLHHLQQRNKWHARHDDVKIGDLVLITDELQPPLKWPLARVEQLHPGSDGLTRVVTLRTSTTTLRRPIVKVIRLPIIEEATSFFITLTREQTSASRPSPAGGDSTGFMAGGSSPSLPI